MKYNKKALQDDLCTIKVQNSVSLDQTQYRDHSLESSRRDDSNEWSQHRVWVTNKRKVINYIMIQRLNS